MGDSPAPVARFSSSVEFCDELERDQVLVDRGIVRVSFIERPAMGGVATSIELSASALVDGVTFVLSVPYGVVLRAVEDVDGIVAKVTEARGVLVARLEAAGFEVRAGTFAPVA